MFKNSYQKLHFSVFYSVGRNPFQIWKIITENGYAKRILDEDMNILVLEIMGLNVSTTYMETPKEAKISLAIKLPFLVMLIKNMHKNFIFEIKILDDTQFPRRYRISNNIKKMTVKQLETSMPIKLSPNWNQIHLNLAELTRRAYGTNYIETIRLTIHANVRIRRIYFTDRLYSEDNLPEEFRLIPRPYKSKSLSIREKMLEAPPSTASSHFTQSENLSFKKVLGRPPWVIRRDSDDEYCNTVAKRRAKVRKSENDKTGEVFKT